MRNISFAVMVAAAALFVFPCSANENSATTEEAQSEVQSVEIKGVKDPEVWPYKVFYNFASKIAKGSDERVHMALRLVSKQTKAPIPGLEVALRGENTYQKVTITEDGYFEVPLSTEALADGAELITNQKSGTISFDVDFVPKLPAAPFRYGELVAVIESGNRAIKEVMPWVLRIVLPTLSQIGLCYPDSKQSVSISGSGAAVRAASWSRLSRSSKQAIYCARFSAKEAGLDHDSLITPAAGFKPIF